MRRSPPLPSTRAARAEVHPGLWLDSRLALWLAAERLLVVADLHWGYAASHRARGNLLPIWGDDEIAQRLQSLIDDYQPAEMLWLGDVVHAAEGAARADAFLRAAPLPITLLAGNHDRRWPSARERCAQRGGYFFHHGDVPLPRRASVLQTPSSANSDPASARETPYPAGAVPADCIEIIGHHHPAVSWGDAAGSRLKLPALVAGPRRIVLPAFSPWSAGTVWNHLLQPDETAWAISSARIFPLPHRAPLS